ncbi:MAG: hypothetical protein LBI89_03935 [Prevotellaceae bacterium]|jgi:hypothetical protein|nr:hypothetical protein [Prevotellaceae bacterium]
MKKYRQTVIPEASTKEWSGLTLFSARKKMFDYYKNYYTGVKVINKDIGITVEFERAGNKKTSYGGYLYPKKACLVAILDKLIRYAEYSNWGERKEKDESFVIGYLNFKVKVRIDGIVEYVHLVIRVRNTGKFQYSIDLNHWEK